MNSDEALEKPITREKVEALARRRATDPTTVAEVLHSGFNADPVSGGFAFVSDRELLVYNVDGSRMYALTGTNPDELSSRVDQWWQETRPHNRTLNLDDVTVWHRAAIAAIVGGHDSVALLPVDQREGIPDIDVADHLLVTLGRYAEEPTERALLRAIASDDWLLSAPRDSDRTHPCPVCGRPAIGTPWRYRSVCDACYSRATCSHGRLVVGYDTSMGGGFEARHIDDDTVCGQVTGDRVVWVDGHRCRTGEAKFGGVFVGVAAPGSPL